MALQYLCVYFVEGGLRGGKQVDRMKCSVPGFLGCSVTFTAGPLGNV